MGDLYDTLVLCNFVFGMIVFGGLAITGYHTLLFGSLYGLFLGLTIKCWDEWR